MVKCSNNSDKNNTVNMKNNCGTEAVMTEKDAESGTGML